jgi:hypothetical protein
MCGVGADGHWHGTFAVRLDAAALRRLGLHPEQPTSAPADPPPPVWWGPWTRGRGQRRRHNAVVPAGEPAGTTAIRFPPPPARG